MPQVMATMVVADIELVAFSFGAVVAVDGARKTPEREET
jgi:alpha/beta superfamily hydrolase